MSVYHMHKERAVSCLMSFFMLQVNYMGGKSHFLDRDKSKKYHYNL